MASASSGEVRQRKSNKSTSQCKKENLNSGYSPGTQARHHGDSATCSVFSTPCILIGLLFTPVILLVLAPSPINPQYNKLSRPIALDGALAVNDLLTKAKRLLQNEVVAPESLVTYGDYIFTGTGDGKVLRIHREKLIVTELIPLGKKPCGKLEWEPTCGRPLGMRIHNDYLYVIDAYLGLFKYDLSSIDEPAINLISGMNFGNDLVISPEGTIYYTESSQRWQRKDIYIFFLESTQDGRLMQYNETSGASEVLLDSLSFPNGVELAPGGDFLVVCETSKARIIRYWLRGPAHRSWDIFSDGLPILPDNIRRSPRFTFWVGASAVRTDSKMEYLMEESPFIRSIVAKIVQLFGPGPMFQVLPKHGMILEFDLMGNIVRSLHDPTGKWVPSISEVEEVDGYIYLGSYFLPFISRLKLN